MPYIFSDLFCCMVRVLLPTERRGVLFRGQCFWLESGQQREPAKWRCRIRNTQHCAERVGAKRITQARVGSKEGHEGWSVLSGVQTLAAQLDKLGCGATRQQRGVQGQHSPLTLLFHGHHHGQDNRAQLPPPPPGRLVSMH